MTDETMPETAAPATSTGPARPAGIVVPTWVAGLLVLVLALGIGFGIGRATGDDHHHDRGGRFHADPRGMERGGGSGRQSGGQPGRSPMPNLPNGPSAPQSPNGSVTPAQPGSAAYLGLVIQNSTGGNGADVTGVAGASPAATAGFQVGDRITTIDGKAVASSADLVAAISGHAPGDSVVVGYVRNGTAATVSVQLAARSSANSTTPPTAAKPALQMIN